MGEKFEKVRDYYKGKLWDIERVRKAVGRWITKEDFELITGMTFE